MRFVRGKRFRKYFVKCVVKIVCSFCFWKVEKLIYIKYFPSSCFRSYSRSEDIQKRRCCPFDIFMKILKRLHFFNTKNVQLFVKLKDWTICEYLTLFLCEILWFSKKMYFKNIFIQRGLGIVWYEFAFIFFVTSNSNLY